MNKRYIGFKGTGWLPPLVEVYLDAVPALAELRAFSPGGEGLIKAVEARKAFPVDRQRLVDALERQYNALPDGMPGDLARVKKEIGSLAHDNTFTVTAGHQLNIFTGPLFTVYKLFSAIRQAAYLSETQKDLHFVPVYWMASEDHDIEEINHVNVFRSHIKWEAGAEGPAGRMVLNNFSAILDEITSVMGNSDQARELDRLFRLAYRDGRTLAEAARILVHGLTSAYGMVVIDGDDPGLKKRFAPVMRDDLENHTAKKLVDDAVKAIKTAGFREQVHARDINLFYLGGGNRERIEESGGKYRTVSSKTEITGQMIMDKPEDFSPNVVLRPLYQEMTLPGVSCVGGPAEISYWLELREVFRHYGVFYPYLSLRSMLIWVDSGTGSRWSALGFTPPDLLRDTEELVADYAMQHAAAPVSLSGEIDAMGALFDQVERKTGDASLQKAIRGERQKAINQLGNLEGKLLRAEKKRHETQAGQIRKIKEKLFPGGSYQERHDSFIPTYLAHGKAFFEWLARETDPMPTKLLVVSAENTQ